MEMRMYITVNTAWIVLTTLTGVSSMAFPRSLPKSFKFPEDMTEMHSESLYYRQVSAESMPQNAGRQGNSHDSHSCHWIREVPGELRGFSSMLPEGLSPFYQKYTEAYNLPVVGSNLVPDEALQRACYVVRFLFADRRDLRESYYKNFGRFAIMSVNELTTDIPEFSDLGSFWDTRARGLGATPFRPVSMAAEENALCYSRDPYVDEDIVLHEFAHGLDLLGIRLRDRQTFNKLEMVYNHALQQGLWANTYARTTIEEYFAEGVQSYFNAEAYANPPNGIHNHISTRGALRSYDIMLYDFIRDLFPCNNRFIQRCDNNREAELNQELRMNCDVQSPPAQPTVGPQEMNTPARTTLPTVRTYPPRPTIKPTTAKPRQEPKCRNNHRHCVDWARAGWCNRSPWMEYNCPKSCDICDDSAEHVGGGGSREVDSVESTEEKAGCRDENMHCRYWASVGECSNNPQYMDDNCRVSCHTCN